MEFSIDSQKKIERRQKRESRSISKRNISGKVNGPRSQSDVIGVEPTDEDIQQADLNTSKVNVAMATITRMKPPRPSTVATEETHISSNFDPSGACFFPDSYINCILKHNALQI